ncbi:MAG: glutamate--tRNA ligase [Peptococcaceae bacterium]|nr:glutamate--tRNA ligase [Peptococcaceae bacterium]
MSKIRVRFAPSPTGHIHVGNIHTTLFNWLFCRHHGGVFVLRLEDTDMARSEKRYEEIIYEEMRWLGLNWDEGPDISGPFAPYRQTERLGLYQQYADSLVKADKCYPCYCTEEELAEARNTAMAKGENPVYKGHCRELSAEARIQFDAVGRTPSLRFRVPRGEKIVIDDLIRGPIEFDSDNIGDFIIVRSNGVPIYNFAVVIDDVTMEITHIIRGDEHISNTPVQILLYRALGFPLPKFAHASIILGEDRAKLSKRKHTDAFVGQFREKGYLPEALFNFLALLGWAPPDGEEIRDRDSVIRDFSLDRVAKSPAVFSTEKLNWLNAHYIKASTPDRIAELSLPFLAAAGLKWTDREWLNKCVKAVQEYPHYLAELPKHISIFFGDVKYDEDARDLLSVEEAKVVVRAYAEFLAAHTEALGPDGIKSIFKQVGQRTGAKGKALFMPVRVALTGRTHGPELPIIFDCLGKDVALLRLQSV